MVGGVTAWWFAHGTKDREVGLRFAPVVSLRDIMPGQHGTGAEGEGRPQPGQGSGQAPSEGGVGGDTRPEFGDDRGWMPPGRGFARPTLPTPEEGILHRDVTLMTSKDPVGVSEWSDRRLQVQTGYKKGTYTYELALPRGVGESGIGIEAEHGAKVHVAVRLGGIPEEDQDLVKKGTQQPPSRPDDGEGTGEGPEGGPGGIPPGGGPGGMGGGGGGRGPGGRGPGGMSNPFAEFGETLDVSFVITLADSAQ